MASLSSALIFFRSSSVGGDGVAVDVDGGAVADGAVGEVDDGG